MGHRAAFRLASAVALLTVIPLGRASAAPAPAGVTIGDNFFEAKSITVAPGTQVVWTDTGSNPHTVTADNAAFDSGGTLAKGQTFTFTFTTPGVYAYHCQIHGAAGGVGMSGTVIVSGRQTPVSRVAGSDRIATGVQASADEFPTAGSASAAVLATAADFPDALAGTPLAVARHAPLLLSGPGALDPRVKAELQRAVPAGKTVYVLGGPGALSPSIDATLQGLGYIVTRYQGATRFATATAIAAGLGDPATILEVTGLSPADALSGGAAAAKASGAVLLTNDAAQAPDTAAYLQAHPSDTRFALGGPAATADPGATPIIGGDRYETSSRVARQFFPAPSVVGASDGLSTSFADGLTGGTDIGLKGGPLLLVRPSAPLPPPVAQYLTDVRAGVKGGTVFGGTAVVGDDVVAEMQQQLGAP